MLAVTLAAATWLASSCLMAQILTQYGRKAAVDKGPRALGLVQLSPKGKKARFTPIAIMVDGKFYDAGAYKADPVPMALDFGIVYEGFRSGVSQGIFTISQPGQLNHVWIAEGTWIPAGERVPEKHKKYSAPVIADDDKEGPPVLHRRQTTDSDSSSDNKDKNNDNDKDKNNKDKDQPKPATPPAAPTSAPSASAPTKPEVPKPSTSPEPAKATTASEPTSDEPITDPNRPRLRRGKPDTTEPHEPFTTFDAPTDAVPSASSGASSGTLSMGKDATAKNTAATPPPIVVIPAISDVGGPDPRPYTYDLKPAEEAIYRTKMLDLAITQLHAQANLAAKEATPASKKSAANKSSSKSKAQPPKPAFDDVSLRIFDLSNSNEPVLVLSAKTQPSAAGTTGASEEPKEITLIARTNLEGELQKLFFSQTDSRHLEVSPRMELIDAVDADGDGRGELLFRRTFDGGSAYAIYRVTADQLWPLFEGTP
ncbi:MAG: hypothetical protein WBD25_17790 [Terriglobales bacterium]|jgi:hypothetical protein